MSKGLRTFMLILMAIACIAIAGCGTEGNSPATSSVQLPYQIGSMRFGEAGYAVSSAVRQDISGTFWLVPNYNYTPINAGSATMLVTRTFDGYTAVLDPAERDTTYKPYALSAQEKAAYFKVMVTWKN